MCTHRERERDLYNCMIICLYNSLSKYAYMYIYIYIEICIYIYRERERGRRKRIMYICTLTYTCNGPGHGLERRLRRLLRDGGL